MAAGTAGERYGSLAWGLIPSAVLVVVGLFIDTTALILLGMCQALVILFLAASSYDEEGWPDADD